jgi:AcrR family transcriptional regulator
MTASLEASEVVMRSQPAKQSSGFVSTHPGSVRYPAGVPSVKVVAGTAPGTDRAPIDHGRIIAVALQLFARDGYRATTMADIGSELGIRGPSLYKHVRAKQDLLGEIMIDTMRSLITAQQAALDAGGDFSVRLRRLVEAHVRYHASHREHAFVGNREISNLQQPYEREVLNLRDEYEHRLRDLIESGCAANEFTVAHPRLISYAILDMGIGVAAWFRPDGLYSADQIAYIYADAALGMVVGATVRADGIPRAEAVR